MVYFVCWTTRFFSGGRPFMLEVIFHQCLRRGLWLLSTPIRKHISDLCWQKLQTHHYRCVHMAARWHRPESGAGKECGKMEHLDCKSRARMQTQDVHMRPCNWTAALKYAHAWIPFICAHIWLHVNKCRAQLRSDQRQHRENNLQTSPSYQLSLPVVTAARWDEGVPRCNVWRRDSSDY